MEDEFSNRLTSFRTALTFANAPERKAVWENQVPKTFGTKMTEAQSLFGPLEAWCQAQSGSIAGHAEAKKIQEEELETAAFQLAQALVTYFLDQDNVVAAEPFRRGISWWQLLRDSDLLLRSQDVIDAATPLTTGAGAAAIAENYGISAAKVAALVAERTDFEEITGTPAAARAGRKGYTALLRTKFKPVTALFRDLDRLVVQFVTRPGGEQFVQGWFAARNVVDAGGGSGSGGGGSQPPPPAAPTGVTATQENPGDPVTMNAEPDPTATLWEALERPAGSSGEFTLIASGGTLPLVFTHEPGDFEFVMRKTTAAGQSALSAPVSLTVG